MRDIHLFIGNDMPDLNVCQFMTKCFLSITLILLTTFNIYGQEDPGMAVIELFTSQGCSSCPRADRVLSEIIDEYDSRPVYGLSFHVDYWNYLGWEDPYSSKKFTERQRQYAAVFQNRNIYTPQMVVNGGHEFVGSNKDEAKKHLERYLGENPENELTLEFSTDDSHIRLSYHISGNLEDKILNIALVERGITTSVSRGENRNRTLHHDNVVRFFTIISADRTGELKIDLPRDMDLSKSSVIGYIQETSSMGITAASSLSISKENEIK
jgi:hypothetical protein